MKKTRTMWTRQVSEVWEELRTNGVYRVKKEYIQLKNDTVADYYLKLYGWYTREAGKYVDIPNDMEYPIWFSLYRESMLQPIENTVILEVEVPEGQYLLCNMDHWGYRVNYWYIPLDKKDEERHKRELERYGIGSEDDLVSGVKGNYYPALRRKIKDSWERVFTILPDNESGAAATTWELRLEWIKGVTICDKPE